MMAQIQDHSTQDKTKPPPRNSCFLGCFGFSGKVLSEKKSADDMAKTGGLKKKTRGFSWSMVRVKKSAAKTVPVDTATVSEKFNRSTEEIPAAKTVKKINSKGQNQIPAGAPDPRQIPATLPILTVSEKPPKTKFQTTQNNQLESREILEHGLNSPKDSSGQSKPSFCRKTGVKRTRVSHPGSPENKFQLGQPTTALTHSVSFPPPKPKKHALNTTRNDRSRVNSNLTHHHDSDPVAQKFDPLIGILIIMGTLLIMLVWGRLCAILCISAWFYIVVPRFRETIGSNIIGKNGSSSVDPNLSSEELKKKVVLEGFLERNHRSSSVIL